MPQGSLTDELATLPLLHGINADALNWLIANSSISTFSAGAILLSPHKKNNTAYILLSGRLEVRLASDAEEICAYLDAGSWVGEMSIIEGTVPSATVITATDSRLLAISGEVLWSLIDQSHAVARNLLHAFSARVRRDNVLIAESRKQQRLFAESAQTDFLTGLRNRRWLDDMLHRLIERCNINQQTLSLIMLDIDHFKAYNDSNGHLAGDKALQTVAHSIRDHIRPTDTAARYGGEEFVVIMPNTRQEDAIIIANRLCDVIRQQQIIRDDGTPLPGVTVSIGLSSLSDEKTADQLLNLADDALYRAKNAGRDQVAA